MDRALAGAIFVAVALGAPRVQAQSAPLTFRRAVAEALAASPALRAPDDERTLALIRERQASAAFGVKLTPSARLGTDPAGLDTQSMGIALSKQLRSGTLVQLDGRSTRFGIGAGQFRDNGYTLGISQPLLRGWTSAASIDLDRARRSRRSAERGYADARQRLVVAVAGAYCSVVRGERLVDAAERTLARARQLKIVSDARARVGLATELDVLRADLLISQSEAALVGEREGLESAGDELKTLLGRPAGERLELASVDLIAVDGPDDRPVDLFIEAALGSRLDLQDARERVVDAKLAETVARWQLLPPLNLDATYTRRGLGSNTPTVFGQLFNGWRVGISSSYALDHSDQSAAAATAAVSVAAAQREAQDAARRISDEVRRAHRAWTRTKTTLEIQSKSLTIAERQLRLAQLRYDRGVAGNFDVIDAENHLLLARSAVIDAEVERAMASLTLRRVTGALDPDTFR